MRENLVDLLLRSFIHPDDLPFCNYNSDIRRRKVFAKMFDKIHPSSFLLFPPKRAFVLKFQDFKMKILKFLGYSIQYLTLIHPTKSRSS